MTPPVLRVRNLSKSFQLHARGTTRLEVLRDVSFDVGAGECLVLDGPSGAGKSTVLKCIFANYLATSGTIEVLSRNHWVDITTAPVHTLIALRNETVGYVSQFLRVVPRVPTIDVVAESVIEGIGDENSSHSNARTRAEAVLLRLNIPRRLWTLPPATFSGGEQQRVNIARSFIRPRPLLLLDEPTASLDATNRLTVVAMILEALASGCAIVGIFHDQAVRDAVATRTLRMAELV